jgi:hypothetical protein
MLSTLTKLAQKPTDKTIRTVRTVFAFILIALIYFGWDVTALNFWLPAELKYTLYVFPIIGLIRGIVDPGLFRKKIWKWTIVALGGLMLVTSLVFIDDVPAVSPTLARPTTVSGEGISISGLDRDPVSSSTFSVSTDNWFGFFGPILAIIGFFLTGKNITTKNERYGEIIKKIRV